MPTRNAKMTLEESIVRQVLQEDIIAVQPIKEGNDGKKFIVTTGRVKLFCKVRKTHDLSELLPNQEVEILTAVNSPHIVTPIKSVVLKGRFILLAPFIEGEDLAEYLRKNKTLSEVQAKKLARTLFETINDLYGAGAIHFDIKPANIIVGNDGEFYIVDFGAARFVKKMRNEKIFPARKYIAPEVLRYLFHVDAKTLQQVSILADMYGAGAVLYEAITGKNLGEMFSSAADVLRRVPTPVLQYSQSTDPKFAALIDKLVAKEPGARLSPLDAINVLGGGDFGQRPFPSYFFRTKPRGEHKNILSAIIENSKNVAIYWVSAQPPFYERDASIPFLLWETTASDNDKDLESKLLKQYEYGVSALCIPSFELDHPLDTNILQQNLDRIDCAVALRQKLAIKIPLLAVIAVDEALINSAEKDVVRDAYAPKNIDGIILRVCAPTNQFSLNDRHLNAIKYLIEPFASTKKVILFDGDLSIIPLSRVGVTGLVATTNPRLQISASKQIKPKFAQKADWMFVPKLYSMLKPDAVAGLRSNVTGKRITDCGCSACANTLMKRGHPSWLRQSRCKHFILTFPSALEEIKKGSITELSQQLQHAAQDARRFPNVEMNLSHLHHWSTFLGTS